MGIAGPVTARSTEPRPPEHWRGRWLAVPLLAISLGLAAADWYVAPVAAGGFVALAGLLVNAVLFGLLLRSRQRLAAGLRDGHSARAASELRFRAVFDQAGAGIGLIDGEARLIEVNERLTLLTGYPVAELIGRPLCELLPPDDRAAARARMRAFLDGGDGPADYAIESPWLRKDGSLIGLSRQIRRLPAGACAPARAVLIAIDISDRQHAEAAAEDGRRTESFQFVHSPMALIEWAPDMTVRRWSMRAEEMFGWSAAEAVGRTLREIGFLTPAEADHHEAVMGRFMRGELDHVESLRHCRRKDGSQLWCRWHSRAMREPDGRLRYFFSTGVDVSELIEANERLDEKERRQRAIFEQASVGIALLDESGRWLEINPRICEITGYGREELLALDFQTITHPDDLAVDVELARQVAAGERARYKIEKRYIRKDGSLVWIALHVGRIDATAGAPTRFVSVIEDISERRRIEREAQEYKRIRDFHFDNTPLAAIEWTPDLKVRRWSRQAERMFGWTEAEVLGLGMCDFRLIHDADLAETGSFVETLLAGEGTRAAHLNRNYRKDGSTVWCDWHNSVLRDASGAVLSFFALASDVTEQQTTLQALHESESQLRGLFEQAAVGIAMLDENGRWLSVNSRLCDILGYRREELLQLSYPQLTHPDDIGANLTLSARLYAGEIDHFTLEKRYIRKDGQPVWTTLYIRRIDATETTPLRCAAIVEDISERKRAEARMLELQRVREATLAELQDSQSRFRSIFEQAAVGIAMIDAEARWLMVNQRFREIVGYDDEELRQRRCLEITEPADRLAEAELRTRLINGVIDDYRFEKRYLRKDGSPVWVTIFARRLEYGEGQPVRLLLAVEDISARKESERKLQELHAQLERKVAERTRQLQDTTRRWAERNHELSLLAEMMGVLPAARDAREANLIVARFLPRLFNRLGGEIWIEEDRPDRFMRVAGWNLDAPGPAALTVEDCWALRRGQLLQIDDPHDPLVCAHCRDAGEQVPHACVPIVALGELIGLIHLRWSERVGERAPPDRTLLNSTAEQIGLAIGNVRLREELRRQAMRDPLTGLYNRRHLDDVMVRLGAEHRRSGRGCGMLLIDIDHFKEVNDRHGHDAGDTVLRSLGALLQRLAHADEAAFRLGGEEFVLLLGDCSAGELAARAERVRTEVATLRLGFAGIELPPVTVSIGAAAFPADTDELPLLIGRADRALYAAKRTGRNRVCYASASPDHPPLVAVIESGDRKPPRDRRGHTR